MPPPKPIRLFHFTHVDHLPGIIEHGLLCDAAVGDRLSQEVGDQGIKARRRGAAVPVGDGGVVADYVPFYFAPRSPMLFRIYCGGVPTYGGRQGDLVYLCTTVEHLERLAIRTVVTDRNAVLRIARFADERAEWEADGFVDWELMRRRQWSDPEHPDWIERRMAECLVRGVLPWEAVMAIGCFSDAVSERVRQMIGTNEHQPQVIVRRQWYF